MLKFIESNIGQIVARNGILAIILGWMLYVNHDMVERLFKVTENNTKAFYELRDMIKREGGVGGRE